MPSPDAHVHPHRKNRYNLVKTLVCHGDETGHWKLLIIVAMIGNWEHRQSSMPQKIEVLNFLATADVNRHTVDALPLALKHHLNTTYC